MNTQQNKQLHALLAQTGLKAHKESLVLGYTNGRSESSRDLTAQEADALIRYLSAQAKPEDADDKMRKKMIHYARQMGWEIEVPRGRKADIERLNNWCIHYGQYHKPLMEHDTAELTRLLSQFDAVYKSFLRGI